VSALDAGDNLEKAMGKVNLLPTTVEMIVAETALLISAKEKIVFSKVLAGEKQLPFTTFVKHLFKAAKKFHLITTNYDRLIEFAAEAAEIGVDSHFFGYLHGRSDSKRSAGAHPETCRVFVFTSHMVVSIGLKLEEELSGVRLKPEGCRSSSLQGLTSIIRAFR
jgi:hypothetical protein